MQVIRIYTNTPLRNYNYLIACEQTKQAIALDPWNAQELFQSAQEHGLSIKKIVNTHEHFDHVQGNLELQQLTGAEIIAHQGANTPGQTVELKGGEKLVLGELNLRVLHTPGHTAAHLCLLAEGDVPMLFSGDTLFNASAGNCTKGGSVDDLFNSFINELAPLPDETLLYPGHDYMHNNLAFALSRDPDNQAALYWQEQIMEVDPEDMPVMTLGQERQYNPFLRLNDLAIYQRLKLQFPTLAKHPYNVFKALRSLRDIW